MSERKTYKNYFLHVAICLLAVTAFMFCGCKQMSHIEKDKHDFEPTAADSTMVAQERIVDTITFVMDTLVEKEPVQIMDTLTSNVSDSIFVEQQDS